MNWCQKLLKDHESNLMVAWLNENGTPLFRHQKNYIHNRLSGR